MDVAKFIEKMKDHQLSVNDLIDLLGEYEKFNLHESNYVTERLREFSRPVDKIAYVCDRTACSDCSGDCHLTTKIERAIHFKHTLQKSGENVYYEMGKINDSDVINVPLTPEEEKFANSLAIQALHNEFNAKLSTLSKQIRCGVGTLYLVTADTCPGNICGSYFTCFGIATTENELKKIVDQVKVKGFDPIVTDIVPNTFIETTIDVYEE